MIIHNRNPHLFLIQGNKIIVLILLTIFFLGCQKDDDISLPIETVQQESPCEFTPPTGNGQLPPGIVDSMYFSEGSVNPMNANEIVFLSKSDTKLYKLNISTGERNVILEDAMGYSWADWGTNDWLLFTRSQNLFKVKSNGDSLTQITFNGVGWYANWNPAGTHYTYVTSSPETGLISVIADKNDVIIDTLSVSLTSSIDWFADSLIYWSKGSYDITNDSLTFHLPTGPGGDVVGISSLESLHLFQGLVLLNHSTGDFITMDLPYSSCHRYIGLDFSQHMQKLLASRLYQRVMPDGQTVYNRGEIVWLNLDGTLHEVIDIAQFMNGE
jgi:hypothetical protein